MSSNNNGYSFLQLLGAMRKSGNPAQFTMNLLGEAAKTNPNNLIQANVLKMAQNGDYKGLEQIARNVVKERGGDFDNEFAAFKKNLNI